MKLGEIEAGSAFGVLLITAERSTELIPPWGSDEDQVTNNDTAAVVRVQHADEGVVAVRVWDDDGSAAGVVAFDGPLVTPSGTIRISDAGGSASLTVGAPPAHAAFASSSTPPSRPTNSIS